MEKNNKAIKRICLLQLLVVVYAMSSFFTKKAALSDALTMPFVAYYAASLFCLFLYAIFWQQILRVTPLSVAYANKSAVIIWQMILGAVFFQERVSLFQVAGIAVIAVGIYLVVTGDE